MKKNRYIIIILLTAILYSCNSKLSRGKAKSIINDYLASNKIGCKMSIPLKWTADYHSNGFCSVIVTNPPDDYEAKALNTYIRRGFMRLQKKKVHKDCAQWINYSLKLTNEAKKKAYEYNDSRATFITDKYKVDEVLGIIQRNDIRAKVEVRLITKPTDFSLNNCNNKKETYYLEKYDDGWMVYNY